MYAATAEEIQREFTEALARKKQLLDIEVQEKLAGFLGLGRTAARKSFPVLQEDEYVLQIARILAHVRCSRNP